MCGIELPASGLRAIYPVLDRLGESDNFNYSGAGAVDSRMPDFRNTLFWGAGLHPDNNGELEIEFYTSDFISDYKVVIEGITDMGQPFSYSKIIRVEID